VIAAPQAGFREAGSGPGIVCLHANASTSGQWRPLMDLLAPKYRVFAPDSYGAGKSPEWPSDRRISLDDEVDLIEPVIAQAGSPLTLIGHSYGAAIALIAARRHPQEVRAERRGPVAESVKNIRRWFHALSTEKTTLAELGALDVPVLYMVGERSPVSARSIARLLVPALPRARLVELQGVGHMGPITHPQVANPVIARFLDDVRG